MGGKVSDDREVLPTAVAEWLRAHPSGQCRQFGPVPSGWAAPVLSALNALDRLGAEVLLCKFKLGSLRLRVRPEDLASPSKAERIEQIISRAQEHCAWCCICCGAKLPRPGSGIDGAHCRGCKPS